jgi:hypothetical protein
MTKIKFENTPSTKTPINAENLNKLNNVVINSTEPTTGEEVWLQKGKNLFDKDNIEVPFSYNTDYLILETGLRAIDTGGTNYQYMAVKLNKSLMGKSITLSSNIIPSANNNGQVAIYYGSSTNPILLSANIYITKTGSVTGSLLSEFPNECSELYLILNSNMDGATKVGDYVDYTNLQIHENSIGKNIYVKNDNDEYEEFTDTVSSGTSPNGAKVWLQRSNNLLDKNNPFIVYPFPDGTTKEWIFDTNGHSFVIEIESNTEYTITKPSDKNIFGLATATSLPVAGGKVTNLVDGSSTEIHITSGENDKYLFGYFAWSSETLDYATLLDGIQVQKGSIATPYQEYVGKNIYVKNDNGDYEEFYNEETIINSGVINGIHYIKFPDGTLIQRGNYSTDVINANSGYNKDINLPISFIDTDYSVNITKTSGGSSGFAQIADTCARNTKIIYFTHWNFSGGNAAALSYSWTAIGRWK